MHKTMSHWADCQIDDACKSITVGIVVKPAALYRNSGVRCFRGQNVRRDGVQDDGWVYISPEGHKQHSKSELRAGDVVIVRTGEPGVACVVPEEYAGSNCIDLVIARPDPEKLDSHFLAAYLNSPIAERAIILSQGGLAQKHLNVGALQRIRLRLPPVREQRAIMQTLRVWDRCIGGMVRLLKLKHRRKRGLMQKILTGRRRFPEFARQPWREVRIDEVLEEKFRPVTWDDNALYRLASVRRGSRGLFWREPLYGRQIKVKSLHTIHAGDFLMSHIQAAYGAMALVPSEFGGGHVSDMYTILAPRHPTSFAMTFFAYLAESPEMRHAAYISSNGFFAERLRLNFDPHDFLRQKIKVPPTKAEQRKISIILEMADREIDLLEQQLAAIREQKEGLMQKLLTGDVRVELRALNGI